MKVIIVCLTLVAVTLANQVPQHACKGGRDDLLPCFDELLDLDSDGNITTAELDAAFITYSDNIPSQPQWRDAFNTTKIMEYCDADTNGVLNSLDWNHANACLKINTWVFYVCRLCYMAGYNSTSK